MAKHKNGSKGRAPSNGGDGRSEHEHEPQRSVIPIADRPHTALTTPISRKPQTHLWLPANITAGWARYHTV